MKLPQIKSVVIVLALLFSALLTAQTSFIEYKGKVINANTKNGIEAVGLNIVGTNINTITNSEGEFLLKVPEANINSKLALTSLGYDSKEIAINTLPKTDIKIKLTPAITQLSEVSIYSYKNAEALVREVFNKKAQTLDNRTLNMTAFYRETIKRRNRNVSLTEAVVNILKQPYTKKSSDIILLDKARKSTDYKRLDTISVKLQGGPFSTMYLDVMKYPDYLLNNQTIDTYNFSFDKPTAINDKKVYVVNFSPKNNALNLSYIGKLYIDVSTLALVRADYTLDLSNKAKSKNLLVRKKPRDVVVEPMIANYKVDYKENNGKWYYSYAYLTLKFRVKKKRKLFNSVYTLSSEMAVTDWKITDLAKTANYKNRLKPTVIITDAISGFSDPNFWGKYNLIEPDKSIETAINKIRKNLKKTN